ncbi:hypothetical protein VTK73DRAFT_7552 [Phialemonium thermophilum]|uniref:tripeptidyl-peptidase II n=1 Tax=Phialemonium thermophilum TaxID=223376 RepID=A0ABR3XSS9_9PEZI
MRSSLSYTAALTAIQFVFVGATPTPVVVESLPSLPPGWTCLRAADPGQNLHLRVALAQPNTDAFEEALYAVSDPEHALYGRHLPREEVAALLAPRAESASVVHTWLQEAGIADVDFDDTGEWVSFRVPVAAAKRLLDADFAVYAHDETGVERIRALKYSVPPAVAQHVSFIAPVTRFNAIKSLSSTSVHTGGLDVSLPGRDCNTFVTPDCLRKLYEFGNHVAHPSRHSLFGVGGFFNQWPKYDQLELFKQHFAPREPDANFTVALVNGGQNNQTDTIHPDEEPNLDIQYAVTLSYKTPVIYYSTGGASLSIPDLDLPFAGNYTEPWLDLVTYLVGLPDSKLPQTLTISYGEDEQIVPRPYAEKVCQMFGQLGARGMSVVVSSGDSGPGSGCQSNDGRNATRFTPFFPAACPFVTSVGGTQNIHPERAWASSSGGFSDIFPRPSYQDAAVTAYLARLGRRWRGLYNPRGRGFPDVAAQAENIVIMDRGRVVLSGGTSAASPIFAAVVALINSARMHAGRPPMGFLNPWLYKVGRAGLTDIVHGGSVGCNGTAIYSGLPAPFVPYASWNATVGWDPVTGLGTPLVQKLLDLSTTGWTLPITVGH